MNAVAHRDYRRIESVFIRQYPRRLEIVSPGGFLPGITPENFLWKQAPRNRRIAEAFAKCGLVERAGQGANRMLEECIKESKPLPDLSGTDEYQVALALRGEVQEPGFLRFLEKIGRERLAEFTTMDLLVIDLVHREQAVPEVLLYAQTRPGPRDKRGPAPETHRRQSRRWKPTGRVDASPSVAVTKADSIAPRDPQNRGKSAPCWTYYQQSLVPGPATVSSSDARLSASWMMHYNSTRCNRIQSVLGLLPKQGVDLGCTAITGCN